MKFLSAFFVFVTVVSSTGARAEPVPADVLDHDYASCMGGTSPEQDPQKAAYCNCIRDGMRSWDLDTYGELATQQSNAQNAQQVPQKIQDLAQACIHKVLP